jgi:hypothetical protein
VRRVSALRVGAVALYAAYWGLSLFGFLGLDRGDVPQVSRELFYAVTIGVPCFLVGAAIGRWWAPAVGLLFVAFVPLADHCVEERVASDATGITCSGVAASDLPLLLAVTTPCVVAGVVAVKALAAWRRQSGGRGGARPLTDVI